MTLVLTFAALLAQAPDPVTQPMADQVERLHREADRIRDQVRSQVDSDQLRREIVERVRQDAERLRDQIRAQVAADQIRRQVLRGVDGASIAAQVAVDKAATAVRLDWDKSKHGGSSAYRSGLRSLDDRKWDEAIEAFKRSDKYKPDAALYWTAFAHYKAGRAEPALLAIGTLNSQYASSPWKNDAQTLAVEIRAAQGKPVNPDSVGDDEIKLIAISGLVRSDSAKAMPYLEKLVTSSQSPRVKEEALNMLARTGSPQARDLVVRVARSGNPEIQTKAIHALGRMEQKDATGVLVQIYNDASAREVKEQAMDALYDQKAIPSLITIAKSEKNLDLKKKAVRYLSRSNTKEANDYLTELLK